MHWTYAPLSDSDKALPMAVGQYLSPCPTDACVSRLVFANSSDGYAFGPSLFVTTDGGATWHNEMTQSVVDLEASGNRVFRIVSPCGTEGQCTSVLQSQAAGSTSWATLPAPKEWWGQVVLASPSLIYLDGDPGSGQGFPGTDLWRSSDGGNTWT
ncbi:MAG TPA: hypothetical protein VKR22_00205, partial [Acidimicrobiales bacterium]|nr:hypothetical protein [Acidimicrobiales bacterium]